MVLGLRSSLYGRPLESGFQRNLLRVKILFANILAYFSGRMIKISISS